MATWIDPRVLVCAIAASACMPSGAELDDAALEPVGVARTGILLDDISPANCSHGEKAVALVHNGSDRSIGAWMSGIFWADRGEELLDDRIRTEQVTIEPGATMRFSLSVRIYERMLQELPLADLLARGYIADLKQASIDMVDPTVEVDDPVAYRQSVADEDRWWNDIDIEWFSVCDALASHEADSSDRWTYLDASPDRSSVGSVSLLMNRVLPGDCFGHERADISITNSGADTLWVWVAVEGQQSLASTDYVEFTKQLEPRELQPGESTSYRDEVDTSQALFTGADLEEVMVLYTDGKSGTDTQMPTIAATNGCRPD